MQREMIVRGIERRYGISPEYLWPKMAPTFCAFRRSDNKKWFGVMMTIGGQRLGLKTDALVEILNVKFDNGGAKGGGEAAEFVAAGHAGIFPAYHMNKQAWISVLLDGTLADEEVMGLVERSFELVGDSGTRTA